MRVGINAFLCSSGANYRRTGVSRYILELISHLAKLELGPEVVAYVRDAVVGPDSTGVTFRNAPFSVKRPPIRIGFEFSGLPVLARRDQLDVFHGPVNTIPFGLGVPTAVTVHDLAFLLFPEQVTRKRYHYLKQMIRSSVRRADAVLTPSESTRQDVITHFGIDEKLVHVTPLGVDAKFAPASPEEVQRVRSKFDLELPVVLFVGTIEPRKNLARLIDASAGLQSEIPHNLVLAGPDGWQMAGIEEAISRYPGPHMLRRIGYVDDADLVGLYTGADVVAIPSIYEGFGLPVLEAMAAGGAVLTSNVSSLPEVAGSAAELVDPGSVDAIGAGLVRVLGNKSRQSELRLAGVARAREFTWRRTAETTFAAYKEALL